MSNSIYPNDILEIGTKVRVRNKIGHVTKVAVVPAVPSGNISVHYIKFTEKQVPYRDRSGKMVMKSVAIDEAPIGINYSFIHVV